MGRWESGGALLAGLRLGCFAAGCGLDRKSEGGYTGSRGGVEAAHRADSGA